MSEVDFFKSSTVMSLSLLIGQDQLTTHYTEVNQVMKSKSSKN